MSPKLKDTLLTQILRALIEIGFIMFLFYANLLMGEFTKTNGTPDKTLAFAINDIITGTNFIIGLNTAIIGYFVFEFLRKKFR
jgi:hypothetical protein